MGQFGCALKGRDFKACPELAEGRSNCNEQTRALAPEGFALKLVLAQDFGELPKTPSPAQELPAAGCADRRVRARGNVSETVTTEWAVIRPEPNSRRENIQ
jgi:hypothetical protein